MIANRMTVVNQILGFEVLATLGYGARSTIFAVKDKDHQIYALKRVVKQSPNDQRFLDQAILEYEVASRFNHPVLRRIFKLYKQRALIRTTEVYVLMEMVDGLTLEQHQPGNIELLCRICQQVAKGLSIMHQAGFVHADIKPNNIMVTSEDQIKIIDFGQSCPIGTVKQRIQGTPDYIAPEQVLCRAITPQTDVFNLGATIYWLLTGRHVPTLIPKGQPGMIIRENGTNMRPPRDVNPQVPPALSQLVMHCIKTDPLERPSSMEDIAERIELARRQLNPPPQPMSDVEI